MSVEGVLIDTSIWIEILRHATHPLRAQLDLFIADDVARFCSIVVAELIQGALSEKELRAVEELERSVPFLEESNELWREAGKLGRHLRQKGVSVGLLDCYLASLSMTHHS